MATDFARLFADSGMRQVLFAVLSVISSNPGISQSRVGTALGIKRTNMVALVNQLVDLGLLSRQPARSDRRAFSLTLTREGETIFEDAVISIREHESRLLAQLDAHERQQLITLLSKIQPLNPNEADGNPPPALSPKPGRLP
ncbi:MAG: MarR family transcriptional regulator [Alphaproteobacteria bacterium]|nr:MarR family transcriptional regulator [Alphaproteobacteria bacterium]MBU0792734.1 MarR family transcriptional regulator [Alphaproteobacteria bacterium]MBU0875816.1 MarR family transcriptional regulator [Alphaproteobacteria bacterium]MBU1770564.1 MarR family transcriptional regulator [Alphaproteobacteria bacterium]